ncbi:MAG: cytochrome ubiquinol oxidase subunit I [Alcaligenaceae bacterium]
MEISALFLARAQFALSLNMHVLFAALAMALGWILCGFRFRAWQTPDSGWMTAYRFWVRIFALSFFLALATALPVLVEFGTLWPELIERTGNVAGPLLAFGLTTFFVTKSLFMGVVLFGQRRVSAKAHFFAVLMVALGLTLTLFWAVVLHTWAQAPLGAGLIDGRYQVYGWNEIILTPFVLWRSLGFIAGAFLFAGLLLLCVTAWQALRRPLSEGERLSFRTGLLVSVCAVVLYWAAFDGNARMVARYQPVVAAAQMGVWQSPVAPRWVWLGSPNLQTRSTEVFLASDVSVQRWLGTQPNASVVGLSPTDEILPPVVLLFWLLRAALLAGTLSSLLIAFTLFVGWRKGFEPSRQPAWLLRLQVWAGGLGALTWLLSWNLSDLGRSPYLVWGALLQQDAVVDAAPATLAWVLVGAVATYAVMVAGFIQMLSHAARFGVVPVRKPGMRP